MREANRQLAFVCAVVALCFCAAASADDDPWAIVDDGDFVPSFVFGGDFQSRTAVDLVADNDIEDFARTRELLYVDGVFSLTECVSLRMSVLTEYAVRVDRDFHETGARLTIEPEELYAAFDLGEWEVRVGQQVVRWGKTDIVSPTDAVNPYDTRRLVDMELGHEKVPLPMAKVDFTRGAVHVEGIFVPFFRPARVDVVGGDWALLGNRFPVGRLRGYLDESLAGRFFLTYLDFNFPDWDDRLEETLSSERFAALGPELPADDLKHFEAAAKFDANLGPTEWGLSAIWGVQDLPTIRFNPAVKDAFTRFLVGERLEGDLVELVSSLGKNALVEAEYERMLQFGLSFAANLGPSVLRGEAAYALGRDTYDRFLDPVERPMLTYTAQLENSLPGGLTFSAQVLGHYVQNWKETLLTEEHRTFLLTYLQGRFWEDRIEAYAELVYNTTAWSTERWRELDVFAGDLQFSAKVSWTDRKNLTVGGGVMLFGGPEGTLLAGFHDRNFAFVDVKVRF